MSIKCNHISLFEGQGNRLSTSERLGLRCVTKKKEYVPVYAYSLVFQCFVVRMSKIYPSNTVFFCFLRQKQVQKREILHFLDFT